MRDFVKARRVGVVVTLFHLADHFFGPVEAVGEMAVVLLIAGFVSAAFKFVNGGALAVSARSVRVGKPLGWLEVVLVMAHPAQSMVYQISRFSIWSHASAFSDPGGRHHTAQKIPRCERAVESCLFPVHSRERHGWGIARVFALIRSSHR